MRVSVQRASTVETMPMSNHWLGAPTKLLVVNFVLQMFCLTVLPLTFVWLQVVKAHIES